MISQRTLSRPRAAIPGPQGRDSPHCCRSSPSPPKHPTCLIPQPRRLRPQYCLRGAGFKLLGCHQPSAVALPGARTRSAGAGWHGRDTRLTSASKWTAQLAGHSASWRSLLGVFAHLINLSSGNSVSIFWLLSSCPSPDQRSSSTVPMNL